MKITNLNDRISIISLEGNLTSGLEKQLTDLLSIGKSKTKATAILDFYDVDSIDNTALSMLVRLHNVAKYSGQRLFATCLSGQLYDVFMLARLHDSIPVFKNLGEAISRAGFTGKMPSNIEKRIQNTTAPPPEVNAAWASPVVKLSVKDIRPEAINLNVGRRKVAGPFQGFGQLWQKNYTSVLEGVNLSPAEIINILKTNFTKFQPTANRFYPSPNGIQPGEIILINAATPGGLVVTGVMVLYVSETSFTFITPEGHPEAGWVTFSVLEDAAGTVVQIQGLARASDPVYEIAFRLAGSKLQQGIWNHVLESLLKYIGSDSQVQVTTACLDKGLQWARFSNIFMNAQILTMIYMPILFCRKLFKW